MRELSVAEQRYQAVLAVISDGLSVKQAAEKAGVSRQTLHAWLGRSEGGGVGGGRAGGVGVRVASASVVSASDAGGGRGGGGGVASRAPVLGCAAAAA